MDFNSQTIESYLYKWNWISNLNRKKGEQGTYSAPYHWHPELEINYVCDGKGSEYFVDGKLNTCDDEKIIVTNPYQVHGFKNIEFRETTQLLTIIFPMEFINRFYPEVFNQHFEIPPKQMMNMSQKDSYQELLLIFKRIIAMKERERGEQTEYKYQFVYIAYVLEILALLVMDFSKERIQLPEGREQKEKEFLQKVLCYIHRNYSEKITLVEIANEANVSVSHLCKLFKEISGYTVYQYIERVRSMHAMDDLKQTQKTVTEIALDNGFVDAKALNRVLRRNYGMSAKEIAFLEI